ncbi:MAG TPA: hypothetical protein VGE45_02405 [Chloroflexia bacterium]
MVDGINLDYHPLRVRPDYYEAVVGLDLWQLRAIQSANTPSPASSAEVALEALLTQRQIRRDTRRNSSLAEEQTMSQDPRQFSADEPQLFKEAITISNLEGQDVSMPSNTDAVYATDASTCEPTSEDTNAQHDPKGPWFIGKRVRQRKT